MAIFYEMNPLQLGAYAHLAVELDAPARFDRDFWRNVAEALTHVSFLAIGINEHRRQVALKLAEKSLDVARQIDKNHPEMLALYDKAWGAYIESGEEWSGRRLELFKQGLINEWGASVKSRKA
ncbi:hypothetical protein [Phyllobacterium bourgognense]|nr:hypothetical protein [Phyllobacterium bourgognense]